MIDDLSNPFFSSFGTPHNTMPFDKIRNEHFEPAFLKGIQVQKAEVNFIVNNSDSPTFNNTIEAYERSGELLATVSSVFFNLLSAESDDEMMDISQRISPILSEHGNDISLNESLFSKIKEIFNKRFELNLTPEQIRLTEYIHTSFVDNGVNLSSSDKVKYRLLSTRLSQLTLDFGQNVLRETNKYQMLLSEVDLAGIPLDIKDAAKYLAKANGKEGWLFDLSAPSYIAFMKYSERRDLREKLYLAFSSRCSNGGDFDNQQNVIDIVNTRLEIANLLGYSDYASFSLKDQMAQDKTAVYELLNSLYKAFKNSALTDVQEVSFFASESDNFQGEIQPWDWSYYVEKLQNEKYFLNDEMVQPYFELKNVIKGIFDLAYDLYGLTFKLNTSIPVYHSEVSAYEVYDGNNLLAILYTDFHPRKGKRQGAWMTEFKGQYIRDGINHRPHVSLVMNFTRPTTEKPALLTFNEVETFLHEFGHGLHGMLANTNYETLSGTNVARDLVELPSQIMENWLTQSEYLDKFATHYLTGEKIPYDLIKKISDTSNFISGYLCFRQLSFGFLDMAWHAQQCLFKGNVKDFEKQEMASTQLLPIVSEACMSTSFGHIFSGGYAAGYYSYKWSEVLDADAFSVFKDFGIFDKKIANSFRVNLLEKGNTDDPLNLYIKFRGEKPNIDALLKRSGIK